jgi:UDP-glucose 4-epimerase
MKLKKCLVAGGAGFIGSNLVDELIDRGIDVVVVDDLSTGDENNINTKSSFVKLDLSECNPEEESKGSSLLRKSLKGVDCVFHLAALARVQPSIINPIQFNKANVDSTLFLLKHCVDLGVERFIYSASSSAYGDVDELPTPESHSVKPLSPYGVQKLIGEQYCSTFSRVYGIKTLSLRYFNVFGERQSLEGAYKLVMGIFAQQRLQGKPLTIFGDGEQRRDFTYVGDVVEANILGALSKKIKGGEVVNIGSGSNMSVNDLAILFGGPIEYFPPVIEPKETLADNSLALELLSWRPTTSVSDWLPRYKTSLGI